MCGGPLDIAELTQGLNTQRAGRGFRLFDSIDSTNRYALERDTSSDDDGLVVLAEQQTAGRGRLGKAWQCPKGAGILCTVVLIDSEGVLDANLLSLIVPIAIIKGIARVTDIRCEVRWPNDILAGTRKLAGVLVEARSLQAGGVRYAVGFGVNCLQHRRHFPDELRDSATSLDLESPEAIDRIGVLQAILQELDHPLCQPDRWEAQDVCDQWRRHAVPVGRRVRLKHLGRCYAGSVVDIDPSAALVVQLDNGGRRAFPASTSTILDHLDDS